MKKFTTFLIPLLVISFLVAAEASAFFPFPGKKSPESAQASGKVTNIDLRKSLVSVTLGDGTSSTFIVEDKTSFSKKGKKISIADLKKGDLVRIEYFVKKGQNRAHAINVSELATSKPKPVTPKKKK